MDLKANFCFRRQKRFGAVDFEQFLKNVRVMEGLVLRTNPSATIKVLTCEDDYTYSCAVTTISSDEVSAAYKDRKIYSLSEFNATVWERSFHVSLICKDEANPEPNFMVCLSCDLCGQDDRLQFYGQCVSHNLSDKITQTFGTSLFWRRLEWPAG